MSLQFAYDNTSNRRDVRPESSQTLKSPSNLMGPHEDSASWDTRLMRKHLPRRIGLTRRSSTRLEYMLLSSMYEVQFLPIYALLTSTLQGSKDAPAPRPNKRPRLGPSPLEAEPPSTRMKSKSDKPPANEKISTQVGEFLEIMQPRTKKGPSWANEAPAEHPIPPQEQPQGERPADVAVLSDLEWMKRRMSQNVDKEGKVFEQSDEEDEGQEGQNATKVSAFVHFI